ncbi:MAG: branched-chain amino acid ABC transporter permease [Rhodospirillaceae bacterium]|nr:branched-chain amino acid ABC transporter permease [Rhodospirillaceae bacterium]
MAEFLQFFFSGITVGAVYAMVALGFTIIYNASEVINFAQGEFVMIGGMTSVFLLSAGLPLPLAIALAVAIAVAVGIALNVLAIEPARGASVVTLIIITIGASILLRGLAQIVFDRQFHTLPAFSGETPITIGGAALQPQALWVLGGALVVVLALGWFFTRTLMGKAMRATAHNRLAAQLAGINVRFVLMLSFALSAAIGAVAGVLVTPITLTSYDAGAMLALKGFAAAILGGMGSAAGAVAGGLLVGIAEAMGAGYISSDYKDAVAFVIILLVLFFLPRGLFGGKSVERV